ncbi:hypothetical protein CBI33_07520 [Rhodococcus erythropolis]|nr:hypothetical protein CBI33_07520 [Rhodococcus erythropolis]
MPQHDSYNSTGDDALTLILVTPKLSHEGFECALKLDNTVRDHNLPIALHRPALTNIFAPAHYRSDPHVNW